MPFSSCLLVTSDYQSINHAYGTKGQVSRKLEETDSETHYLRVKKPFVTSEENLHGWLRLSCTNIQENKIKYPIVSTILLRVSFMSYQLRDIVSDAIYTFHLCLCVKKSTWTYFHPILWTKRCDHRPDMVILIIFYN